MHATATVRRVQALINGNTRRASVAGTAVACFTAAGETSCRFALCALAKFGITVVLQIKIRSIAGIDPLSEVAVFLHSRFAIYTIAREIGHAVTRAVARTGVIANSIGVAATIVGSAGVHRSTGLSTNADETSFANTLILAGCSFNAGRIGIAATVVGFA